MRVIGGEFRSRRLKTLPGLALRPTPDRLRETLFDVLAPRLAGTVFLDAYAGAEAVGIEALSRGAARAIFIEKSRDAVKVIHQNLKSLGLDGRALTAGWAASSGASCGWTSSGVRGCRRGGRPCRRKRPEGLPRARGFRCSRESGSYFASLTQRKPMLKALYRAGTEPASQRTEPDSLAS